MDSFDSPASSFVVSATTYDDEFYDYSDFEPISICCFSHYGEMPMIKVTVDHPTVRPVTLKPKK